MTLVPGYDGMQLQIKRTPDLPGLIYLTVIGKRGGKQATITLSQRSAYALAAYLNDPEGGMKS